MTSFHILNFELDFILYNTRIDMMPINKIGIARGNSGIFDTDELVSFCTYFSGNTVIWRGFDMKEYLRY